MSAADRASKSEPMPVLDRQPLQETIGLRRGVLVLIRLNSLWLYIFCFFVVVVVVHLQHVFQIQLKSKSDSRIGFVQALVRRIKEAAEIENILTLPTCCDHMLHNANALAYMIINCTVIMIFNLDLFV